MQPPRKLWLVRHGESAGNVAHQRAYDTEASVIDVDLRDMDVPLSDLGTQQARAFGRWLAHSPEQPTVVLTSPYVRAVETARLALETARLDVPSRTDERLRDRDFGVLDRLTRRGIEERHPEQAQLRSRLGKFYHRPPGGEAWTDVLLRLRSVLSSLREEHRDDHVMVVAHDVVVLCFRYLLEDLDERSVLRLSHESEVANCSLTAYDEGRLDCFNVVAPLTDEHAAVTREPTTDVHV